MEKESKSRPIAWNDTNHQVDDCEKARGERGEMKEGMEDMEDMVMFDDEGEGNLIVVAGPHNLIVYFVEELFSVLSDLHQIYFFSVS